MNSSRREAPQSLAMKFLAFTTDVPPLPGLPTSGTALRTFGLVQGLRAHGHHVEVSAPRAAVEGLGRLLDTHTCQPEVRAQLAGLQETAFDFRNQAALVEAMKPDVVLCGHWPAATFSTRLSQPLVIDLAGPHLLERHYQGDRDHAAAVLGKLNALAKADCFIVSGHKQRLYFLAFLLRAGVSEPAERMLTIHMPLCPETPATSARKTPEACYPRFVFAGVFLPWQDPTPGLEWTAATLAERRRGSLKLVGGAHPSYDIGHGVYAKLFAGLSRHSFVQVLPMLPYERFLSELATADVALDLMRWNLERELAMTIRSTTYLWSGLPVIYNDYADLGDLIRGYDAGWTVSPSDPAAFRRVLDEVFEDAAAVARKGRNASRLAREIFSWDRAVVPLLDALKAGVRGPLREVDVSVAFPQDPSLAVLADRPIEQYFLSRIDGLCRVECCIATHGRRAVRGLCLSLYRAPGGGAARELLARRDVPGEALRDNEWLAVEVEPIADSAGETFVLALESDARHQEESASPWALTARVFPLLELYHGGRPVEQRSLCFRTTSVTRPR